MSELGSGGQGGPPAIPGEAATMGPLARFVNVLFSPGKVFEDVKRNPAGWWTPILIVAVAASAMSFAYISRYDVPEVTKVMLRDSVGMKITKGQLANVCCGMS